MYIYVHPPTGPCPSPSHTRNCLHYARSWRRWGQKTCLSSPTYRRYKQYQLLTCLRQLLWNQLPLFRVYFTGGFSHRRCVTVPMYKITLLTICDGHCTILQATYCSAKENHCPMLDTYHIRSIWHLCNTIGDAAWTEASREFSAPVS